MKNLKTKNKTENTPNGYRNHFESVENMDQNGELGEDHLNDPNGRCCIHDGCELAQKDNSPNSCPELKNSLPEFVKNSSVEKLIKKLENCKFLADNFLLSSTTPTDENETKNLSEKFNETFKKLQDDVLDTKKCCDHEISNKFDDVINVDTRQKLNVTKSDNELLYLVDVDDDSATNGIELIQYKDETQMPDIMRLITRDLSEPYSIYTYRYFIHNWPHLCFLAKSIDGKYIGAIVCKLSLHARGTRRGYIAMLAVDEQFRRQKIGTRLVTQAIEAMLQQGCDEVVLETEVTNKSAMKLYENLGFARDKRLFRYYLNGVDAFRLKLWLKPPQLVQYL